MRLAALTREQMTLEQRRVYDNVVAGRRGGAPSPLLAWLRNPDIAEPAERLGEAIRFDLVVPARLVSIAAMTVAAHWNAGSPWQVQSTRALAQGVAPAVVDAIRAGRPPAFDDARDAAVHGLTRTLLDERSLDDAAYAAGVALLGERGMVELIAAIGYYTLVSLTASVFELQPP